VEGAANVPGLFQHLKRGPKAAARSIPAPEGGAEPHTCVLGRAEPQVLTRSPWRGAKPGLLLNRGVFKQITSP
jgi:hypothetical protein